MYLSVCRVHISTGASVRKVHTYMNTYISFYPHVPRHVYVHTYVHTYKHFLSRQVLDLLPLNEA